MQSFGFTENLFYTSCQHPFFTPCYNGNLAAQTWSYGSHTNGYFYSYDNRNRLSMATGMVDENYYDYLYDESFRYDKQGNILNVERFDNADIVDFLSCTYDGN